MPRTKNPTNLRIMNKLDELETQISYLQGFLSGMNSFIHDNLMDTVKGMERRLTGIEVKLIENRVEKFKKPEGFKPSVEQLEDLKLEYLQAISEVRLKIEKEIHDATHYQMKEIDWFDRDQKKFTAHISFVIADGIFTYAPKEVLSPIAGEVYFANAKNCLDCIEAVADFLEEDISKIKKMRDELSRFVKLN